MRLRGIESEDFANYRKPSMFLATCKCDFKCCVEARIDKSVCQNEPLAQQPVREYCDETLCDYYVKNSITKAVCIGGLEPMLQFDELVKFIDTLRAKTDDDVVIYTGYTEDEVADKIAVLSQYKNIIVKFGRYKPNQPSHYDDVLGVKLASPNQYAKRIS